MIGRIRGNLIEKSPPMLLIEANGVGYEILAPMTTIYELKEIDVEVILYTHFIVREDVQQLYGFITKADRKLFQELIKVNGIGAKMALAILSGMDSATLISCVESQDHSLLVSIPGIGKKTAERLIVEMKDKIDKLSLELSAIKVPTSAMLKEDVQEINNATNKNLLKQELDEAISALEALGYRTREAQRIVMKVKAEANGVEDLIRLSLKSMIKV